MARIKKVRVAVLCGGPSSEREVSLKSGTQVAKALPRDRFAVTTVEIGKAGEWLLRSRPTEVIGAKSPKEKGLTLFDPGRGLARAKNLPFDVAFIAMHGKFGEDGTVQTILELLSLPYTGSGPLASGIGMDKLKTLEIASSRGVPIPRTIDLRHTPKKSEIKNILARIGLPCVVKPNAAGSSVGVTIVRKPKDLIPAVRKSLKEDPLALIQEFIRGRELTCGVMGNAGDEKITILPPVEIIPDREFFDYEAKYNSPGTKEICPAHIPAVVTQRIQTLARITHQAIGCDGLTRSDFILTPGGKLVFLEINTIPGLTEASLCPKEAKAAGIPFGEFLSRQIELTLKKHRRKN